MIERRTYDVLDETCPSRQVIKLIADKWSVLVIYALTRGVQRHGELQRRIGGISQKMLTQTLRDLEHNGLLVRTVHPVVPPMVEYELTPLGVSLGELLRSMCSWAYEHLCEVEQARRLHERNER